MNKTPSSLLQLLGKTGGRRGLLQEQYGSVLEIATSSLQQLMSTDKTLHISEAQALHEQAKAISNIAVRQFREQRLTTSIRRAFEPGSGIRGLVDAPTYNDLFRPDWAQHCPTDAIEATTSPIAYLADLYREVQKIEQSGRPGEGQDNRILLSDRRRDLARLMLDHTALERVEPTLVLVNEILESSARDYLDDISDERSVDDVLLDVRYPMTLPYERYQQQINYTLLRQGRLPGDVIRCTDPAWPYFKEPGVHSLLSDIALVQDTGFGPVQQGILLEAVHFPQVDGANPDTDSGPGFALARIDPRTHRIETPSADPESFFRTHFGVDTVLNLLDTQVFCLQTGLKTEELESLLSVGAYAPYQSVNLLPADQADGAVFGSVYVNAGISPAMSIETATDERDGPCHLITDWSRDRFDRLSRMVRLAQWLKLPFDQVDRLLVASIRAERKTSDYRITSDTLRALGLFQSLRTNYKVSVDDFAAMLHGLAVHARGKQPTQFDQVFNSQALFSKPLILDGVTFTITPGNDAERQKVDHLCAALGMTYEMYRFTAKVIEQAYAGEPLCWSADVVSAFYRLVRLPHYLGLTTIEALALLELLDNGGSQLVSKLAGPTHIASYQTSGNTDTLSVIHALVEATAWLAEHQWTVGQVCRIVLPALTKPVASDAELNLLKQMHTRLAAALISDSSFAEIGAPDTRMLMHIDEQGTEVFSTLAINWFRELSEFIDTGEASTAAKGLVKYLRGETEENFEAALSEKAADVLKQHGLSNENLHAQLCNMIMRARGAQEALLMEGLAGYLDTSVDLARVLLFWTEGNRYQLLLEVLRVYGLTVGTSASLQLVIGDEVLLVLDSLVKRAAVTTHLDLSPAFVGQCVQHPQWFGLDDVGLSLQTLYFFSQYASTVRLSAQPEERLLDYLRLINTVWDTALEGDKRLIRDSAANKLAGFLDWGVRQVLAVAFHLNPQDGVIFSLAQLDLLVRTCLLAQQTGLDAEALLVLGNLTPTSAVEAFRYAAELALASLTEPVSGTRAGEVGQSHSSVITVTPDYLVARQPGESASYRITLRDFMDEPFDQVTITWSTNLGVLDERSTVTTDKGESSVRLLSGDTMGIAHVVAEYGLGDKVLAPVVTIGCDEATLHFAEPTYDRREALSNKLETINLGITLVDNLTNKGVDRLVIWGTTLGEFQRYQTLTNHEGISHAGLRSGPQGSAQVVAQYENGSQWSFPTMEFTSTPYFQYVRFDNMVVENVEVGISCRLVELNGDPVSRGTTVTWEADADGLLVLSSETDNEGIARSRFQSDVTGSVTVTVNSSAGIQSKSSAVTTIYPRASIVDHEATDTTYILGDPEAVEFYVWLKVGDAVGRNLPVEWKVDGEGATIKHSDSNGKASFTTRFLEEGFRVVTATIAGQEDTVDFPIRVVDVASFAVTLSGAWGANEHKLLSRGSDYSLNVKLLSSSGQIVSGVGLSLGNVGTSLEILSVVIPDVDKVVESSTAGVDFLIRVSLTPTGNLQGGDLQLKLSCGALAWTALYKIGMAFEFDEYNVVNDFLWIYFKRVDGVVGARYISGPAPILASASKGWSGSGSMISDDEPGLPGRRSAFFLPKFESSQLGRQTCTFEESGNAAGSVIVRSHSFTIE
ncbi:hypothetical protein HX890_15670 [Pseudomonas gingeri]|uniref:Tc toxin subunit A n=1 Tax=Pseudomonas gingeri TaxID=117681 RepID=UPI00159FEDFA|nr:Tc toxin subunit A [Pseudomonas gingeri]NWD75553.1 hypothetical protein [Pseudomonas gingeri]